MSINQQIGVIGRVIDRYFLGKMFIGKYMIAVEITVAEPKTSPLMKMLS